MVGRDEGGISPFLPKKKIYQRRDNLHITIGLIVKSLMEMVDIKGPRIDP